MWLQLIRHSHWTKQSRFNGHWLLKLPESKCNPSLNDEQVNRDCVIHAHCTWLKVHIDSCHGSESIIMMRHAFVHQWINEWMNWPKSRCSDQTDDSYDRLTINHNLNWCHSSNEVKNVSFRWTLMVSTVTAVTLWWSLSFVVSNDWFTLWDCTLQS